MVFLSEWLPNPTGPDATGEFIELYNDSPAAVPLHGWRFETESGKKFIFKQETIPAHGYLVAKRSVTKLALRNSDGALALYDTSNTLIDRGKFYGSAPEGKSVSRVDRTSSTATEAASALHFALADPTPGAANKITAATLEINRYPTNTPLNHPLDAGGFFAIMIGEALLLAGLILYVIQTNEDLSKLFFRRDR